MYTSLITNLAIMAVLAIVVISFISSGFKALRDNNDEHKE